MTKKNPVRQGGITEFDESIWRSIEKIGEGYTLSAVLDAFALFARRETLMRFLAHVDVFQRIVDLPGSVAEVGVFRGTGLMTWAKLFEIYCPGDRTRKVFGFDNFSGISALHANDGAACSEEEKEPGGFNAGAFREELEQHIAIFTADSLCPRDSRVVLVEGDICETAAKFVATNQGVRLSLLHLDCDLYAPSLAALRALYPLVVPGGIVLLDEYAFELWPGESAALEEYFGEKMPRIQKHRFCNDPGGFFIKE